MKDNVLGKVQLIVLIAVGIYVVMPDLFVGPIDDAAIAAIGGIAEVVLAIMRAMSNSDTERMSDGYGDYRNYDSFDNYDPY